METIENVETVDIDAERFISLEFARHWPKYVIAWSVRQRSGDSDFPLADGVVEQLPPEGANLEAMWAELREDALRQAMTAAESASPAPSSQPRQRPLLGRFFQHGPEDQ